TVLPEKRRNDYRVLQPELGMDPNRNCSEVRFDALGMVVGTAVIGKPEENPRPGDRLNGAFRADLTQAEIDPFLANPRGPAAAALLADATARIVYDLTAYWRESVPAKKPPAVAATLARETHVSDLSAGQLAKIQVSLSYSDGFGRETQKKIQAEPGPVPQRDVNGEIIVGADGQPLMTLNGVSPRGAGPRLNTLNNKGNPLPPVRAVLHPPPPLRVRRQDRRQPGTLLRSSRARGRHSASQPHLGEGGLRPVAAGDLGRQRHGPHR